MSAYVVVVVVVVVVVRNGAKKVRKTDENGKICEKKDFVKRKKATFEPGLSSRTHRVDICRRR